MFQANCSESRRQNDENKNWDQEINYHVLLDGHETIFLILEAVGRGCVRKLKEFMLLEIIRKHILPYIPRHKSPAWRKLSKV